MKKIINAPEEVVSQTLDGFLASGLGMYERAAEGIQGVRLAETKDKVALVIGGGSGHEPMFGMFLGDNLADAAACGNIFASPDPNTILQTVMSVEKGKGALLVYGNYAGDNLNFDMAAELLEDMGVQTRTVRVWDDVASAPKDRISDRRGIAGDVFVIRVAGASTAAGLSLEEAYRVTAKARDNTFTLGVALSGGTIPGEDKPSFTLPEDEIEFGMGVHGEKGIKRVPLQPADEIVDTLTDLILADSGIGRGDRVCTLVNGLGSTTLAELYIMNGRLAKKLEEEGVIIHSMDVGSYITCQEMAGASITLMRLDDELEAYMDKPCSGPHYSRGRVYG